MTRGIILSGELRFRYSHGRGYVEDPLVHGLSYLRFDDDHGLCNVYALNGRVRTTRRGGDNGRGRFR